MSDTRFVIAGVALIFAGVVVLGAFGDVYRTASIESEQFGTCHEYSDDRPPSEINCAFVLLDQAAFFGLVAALIGGGIFCLVRGARGGWDNKVRPEDAVGPGNSKNAGGPD